MSLEQLIRYAITGILLQGGETEALNEDIQELVDILIDFGNITDKSLIDILNNDTM